MPLTELEFSIGVAIVSGLFVAFIVLNKWRRRAGWWMLAGAAGLIIIGNVVEKVATGSSALF